MRRWILRFVLFIAAFALAAGGYSAHYLSQNVPAGTAYFAKILCSSVFVSGRDPDDVLAVDLALDHPLTGNLDVDVDHGQRTVGVSFKGLFERRAVFRDGLGCTLALDVSAEELHAQVSVESPSRQPAEPWPDNPPDAAMTAALDRAFGEPDPERPRRTRAVAVVHDGRLVAERYAPGFGRDMPLTGWSMTKSLTNTLVGLLVEQGRLDLHAPAPVPEWQGSGDPRGGVTLDQLLRMSSGLEFEETYFDPLADVQLMLFRRPSAAGFAAAKPLAAAPDSRWSYSSGTSNIVSRVVRGAVEEAGEDYFTFPRRALFDRLGMRHAVIEPDASGTFVGSSFSHATARGWARLGQLYLQDGVWDGERLLPEGWVAYSTSPTPRAPRGRYGAHFWLNAGDDESGGNRPFPELPPDAYFMSGFEGQSVTMVPSRRAVIVRLGMSKSPTSWDRGAFVADVLAALP